jgi:hypothetical protein
MNETAIGKQCAKQIPIVAGDLHVEKTHKFWWLTSGIDQWLSNGWDKRFLIGDICRE